MAGRYLATSLAYPRRATGARNATRVDLHALILIVGLLALTAFAGVLYLSQASVAAELRYRLDCIEGESAELWERNVALQLRIADLEDLAVVESRANHLGMVNAPLGGPYMACTVPDARVFSTAGLAPAGANTVQGSSDGAGLLQRLAYRLKLVGGSPTGIAALDSHLP